MREPGRHVNTGKAERIGVKERSAAEKSGHGMALKI